MSQQDRIVQNDPTWAEPMSEPESHTEHQAALDATLFGASAGADELVLVLEAGQLRIRRPLNA